jgi:hypothetical protein
MISPHIHVGIQIDEPGHHVQQLYPTSPSETLAVLFGRVARDHGLTGAQGEWVFLFNGQSLKWTSTLGEVSRSAGDPELLLLTLTRVGLKRGQGEGAGGDWGADAPAPPTTTAGRSYGGGGRGGFSGPAPGAPPAPAAAPPPASRPAPKPQPADTRRREEADTRVFGEEEESPRKRKKVVSEAKKGASAMDDEEELESRRQVPRFDEDEDDLDDAGISRQATVRYYHRMNPQRVYPFLVVLSKEEIAEIVQGGVKQTVGERFAVEAESPVEVEPVLPGCQVYPPKHTLVIGPDTQTLEFWVVPQVLGKIKGAKVIVRQGGETLSEVKLEAKVAQQTAAMIVGALSFVMPYVTKSLKTDNADGSPLQGAMNWAATNLRPEAIWAGLALVAVGLYFWCRPRKRDQFWDVTPKR